MINPLQKTRLVVRGQLVESLFFVCLTADLDKNKQKNIRYLYSFPGSVNKAVCHR